MKVVKREVKTVDVIEFDADELKEIVADAHINGHYDEFKGWGTEHVAMLYRIKKWDCFNSAELDYIANYFGYDRWEHCGYFCKKSNRYHMIVSCTGDITR